MAVPESLTIRDLTGKFRLNKELSEMKWDGLKLAGVSWLVRKALQLGQLHVHIKHYVDSEGVERMDVDQTLFGGIPIAGTHEKYILDWVQRDHEDHVFGAVVGKARRLDAEELGDYCSDITWTPDTLEKGFVYADIENDSSKNRNPWSVEQTWGIAIVQGERRYVRKKKITGAGNEVITARVVYDYVWPYN